MNSLGVGVVFFCVVGCPCSRLTIVSRSVRVSRSFFLSLTISRFRSLLRLWSVSRDRTGLRLRTVGRDGTGLRLGTFFFNFITLLEAESKVLTRPSLTAIFTHTRIDASSVCSSSTLCAGILAGRGRGTNV